MGMCVQLRVPLLLALTSSVLVKVEGTCGEGDPVPECTTGFQSQYLISAVERSTNIHNLDRRQVLIPDINFTCDGTIQTWRVGAKWMGETDAYIELQIWRRSSGSVYTKVDSTTIMVGTENDNQLYEYPLETPLAFQERDILGFFQPRRSNTELNLCLEDSSSLTTYYYNVPDMGIEPPDGPFDLISLHEGDEYPLIGVETDPPGCGCGFMTVERMLGLLSMGEKQSYHRKQLIFPDIRFTCSGQVVKWIMGGTWNAHRDYYPQLQVWRPSGDSVYHRQGGSNATADMMMDDGVYEFTADPPIPFQPGDVLGVFQPSRGISRLWVDYDDGGNSMCYYAEIESTDGVPLHTDIDVDTNDISWCTGIPLVTAGIVAFSTTLEGLITSGVLAVPIPSLSVAISYSSHLSLISVSVQATPTPLSITVSRSRRLSLTSMSVQLQATPTPSDELASNSTVFVGVGVAGALLVLIIATVIMGTVFVCLRRSNNKLNTTDNVAYLSTLQNSLNTNEVYNEAPDIHIPTSTNQAYLEVAKHGPTSGTDVITATNPAYIIGHTSNTNIPTSANKACPKGGPIYEDADIPTSTNQSCQDASDTQTYEYMHT